MPSCQATEAQLVAEKDLQVGIRKQFSNPKMTEAKMAPMSMPMIPVRLESLETFPEQESSSASVQAWLDMFWICLVVTLSLFTMSPSWYPLMGFPGCRLWNEPFRGSPRGGGVSASLNELPP